MHWTIFISTHLVEDIGDVLLVARFTHVAKLGSVFRWNQTAVTNQRHALC